jgi:hypothetical protein
MPEYTLYAHMGVSRSVTVTAEDPAHAIEITEIDFNVNISNNFDPEGDPVVLFVTDSEGNEVFAHSSDYALNPDHPQNEAMAAGRRVAEDAAPEVQALVEKAVIAALLAARSQARTD